MMTSVALAEALGFDQVILRKIVDGDTGLEIFLEIQRSSRLN
jgi:hypothetical protein